MTNIPEFIGLLTNLQQLYLNNNKITNILDFIKNRVCVML